MASLQSRTYSAPAVALRHMNCSFARAPVKEGYAVLASAINSGALGSDVLTAGLMTRPELLNKVACMGHRTAVGNSPGVLIRTHHSPALARSSPVTTQVMVRQLGQGLARAPEARCDVASSPTLRRTCRRLRSSWNVVCAQSLSQHWRLQLRANHGITLVHPWHTMPCSLRLGVKACSQILMANL